MKTIEEAGRTILSEHDYFLRNRGIMEDVQRDPLLLTLLLAISCESTPVNEKLLKAISMGVSIGMEMEKP